MALLFPDQDEPVRPEEYPLELGDECILASERVEEARLGYDILKKIESSNFDTLNFALAYYAYALGNPSECLDHLKKVPDVAHVQNHIPLPATLRANTLRVPTGGSSITTSPAESIAGTESTISIADIKDGRAWAITETIRSLCLQGMSHEKLFPTDPRKALKIYAASFPLLTIVETELASTFAPIPTSTGKINFSSFTRFREWRCGRIRHLTRLLYVSGDIPLARRTLRLYVQIVSKAHQASTASGITGEELEHEADTDQSWVQTCVFGARMLCRIVSSTSASVSTGRAKVIMDDLREAETLIGKAKTRLNVSYRELSASVDLAEGIWLTVMAIKQHNSDTRPSNFAKAHALFLRSIDTFPTASAHYHIALS
ncbi:cargo-transport protein ypp1 [Lentinula edodes]|uniref:Cargo-transport protein ypp1 n=1 Tax=Lentinula edodes TaxID=5353 RepID=A0A1Q3ESN6_LENED|nr:cargo-transport protein ypp1 [Lentinula edodes]